MSLATSIGVLEGSSATGVNIVSYGNPSPATSSSDATRSPTSPVLAAWYASSMLEQEHASNARMSMYTPASTMACSISSSVILSLSDDSSQQKPFQALPWFHGMTTRWSAG